MAIYTYFKVAYKIIAPDVYKIKTVMLGLEAKTNVGKVGDSLEEK